MYLYPYIDIDCLKKLLSKLGTPINIKIVLYKVEAVEVVVLIKCLGKLIGECSSTELKEAWILLNYILD